MVVLEFTLTLLLNSNRFSTTDCSGVIWCFCVTVGSSDTSCCRSRLLCLLPQVGHIVHTVVLLLCKQTLYVWLIHRKRKGYGRLRSESTADFRTAVSPLSDSA